ncbi:DUF4097 family beta strand repeat-containing protein [Planococcus lenghuensis]|uniref:DUF4097 domain-containing protein n=1 Tax=Planococcus lenghuensis TaxID=2213202 RepID=A0A1Q2KWV1_9BACL|nr:DUF4097 family beta strand repeat-containing protein [Planococcus lenghuensis]AQQ52297.1 hypothetical protein B0X71_03680 [Planococcus lenghuensis]
MKKIIFVLLLAVVVVVGGSLVWSITNLFSGESNAAVNEVKSFNGNSIAEIDASTDVGDITIEESADDEIHVELKGDLSRDEAGDLKFGVEDDDGTLHVTVSHDNEVSSIFSLFSFGSKFAGDVNLEIQLPKKEFDSIRLASNVGDIEVNEAAGPLDIETEVGEIRVTADTIVEDIAIHSNVGDVEFKVNEVPANVTIDLRTDVGDASTEQVNGMQRASGREVMQELGEGGPTLKIATQVGEIDVKQQ